MTSAVLYGTTSDNILKPVRVTDSGEFVTDGGGGMDWYANFYVGGTEGDPSISLLADGVITGAQGYFTNDGRQPPEAPLVANNTNLEGYVFTAKLDGVVTTSISSTGTIYCGKGINVTTNNIILDGDTGTITAVGDVYCNHLHQADGYDLSKIGQALSTIHDVVESVDDLHGLKTLLHLLLDNLKSPYDPPEPPEPPE